VSKNFAVKIFVEHGVDEISGLVDVSNYVHASQVTKGSYVVDIDKGKGVLVYVFHEQEGNNTEYDGSSSSKDEGKSVTFDDGED
jgi:phenylalanyl-tRNA synthetase beta subunit